MFISNNRDFQNLLKDLHSSRRRLDQGASQANLSTDRRQESPECINWAAKLTQLIAIKKWREVHGAGGAVHADKRTQPTERFTSTSRRGTEMFWKM